MSYIGIPPFGNTVRSVTNVTATASQTTFNITGGYVIGYVDVFLNGVLLTPSDYTASNGLTVVLNTGASASDEFQAISYQPVSIGNVLPSTGGTVSGDITLTSGNTLKTNAILDASGGNTTTINGATPTAYNTMGKNLVINGAMQIAQRGTQSTGITTTGFRTVDHFRTSLSSLGTWTEDQSTDAPSGFSNSFKLTCTTADASPAAGDVAYIRYMFEGLELQNLAYGTSSAKSMTLSFWVKSNKTGSASVQLLQNDNSSKNISPSYTISSADTWEYKTISIPADTAGNIDNDNGPAVSLIWWLNSGSTYSSGSTQTSWSTYSAADSNPANLGVGGATSDYIAITGVQLEAGSVATEFERRPYGMELQLCQRYYQHSYATGTVVGTATSVGAAHQGGGQNGSTTGYLAGPWILFPVQLRTFPTVTVWDTAGNSGFCHRFTYAVGGANSQPYTIAATSDKSIYGYSSGSTNYAGVAVHWRVEAEL